jgi:hypothetical protein
VSDTKRLRIVQASGLFSLDDRETIHDIKKLLSLNADIYLGTESGDQERKSLFRRQFVVAGYIIYLPSGTDAWIAVKSKLAGSGHSQGFKKMWGTGAEMHDEHHYDAKGITWFDFFSPIIGYVHLTELHYMRTAVTGDAALHHAVNKKIATASGQMLLEKAMGPRHIGFFGADTNMLDEHSDVFFGLPITTCWDELNKYPPTLRNSTIDVVASVDDDGRVACKSAKVLTDKAFFLHQDHFVVVTEYTVRKINREE